MKDPALSIEQVSPAGLTHHPRNSRTHPASQIAMLKRSIEEYGFIVPVLLDASDQIIAGHGRVMAAQELGLERVPAIRVGHLSPNQVRAFVIADNRLSELAGWDNVRLQEELSHIFNETDIDLETMGYSDAEARVLIEGLLHSLPSDAKLKADDESFKPLQDMKPGAGFAKCPECGHEFPTT